jgi:hypothetical protein
MNEFTPGDGSVGQPKDGTLRQADYRTSAESLAAYKGRFVDSVGKLVTENQLPNVMGQRLQIVKDIPILVTDDPAQRTNQFDAKTGRIMMASTYELQDDLHTDHEMTHPLVWPGLQWEPLIEGLVQKTAKIINGRMQHSSPQGQDFYEPHQEVVNQITRITGITHSEMLEIASQPQDRYDTLGKIKDMTNLHPDQMVADAQKNLEEINRKSKISIKGKEIGVIDYAKQLQGEVLVAYKLRDPLGYQPTPLEEKKRDEAAMSRVVEGLKEIPSLYPVRPSN